MASMTDPGILCIQHCNSKIFSLVLPEKCPLCQHKLLNDNSNFGMMPFRLPYPFVKATQAQASVILRPTNGDFLNDYNNQTDLHIAVTTSSGTIVEFDRHGLRRHAPKDFNKSLWEQSLLVESVPEPWYDHWDDVLSKTCKQSSWTDTAYKKDTHNCYTFVLNFLQALDYGDLSKMACNRNLFCEKFIVNRTIVAGKYISLFRKIRDNGFYIHANSNKTTNTTSSTNNTTNAIANSSKIKTIN
ncbi:unnamed protein product [Diamesa tonsa]